MYLLLALVDYVAQEVILKKDELCSTSNLVIA